MLLSFPPIKETEVIDRQPIRAYMRTLIAHLDALERHDREEVIREIEGHLHDVVDQADARGEPLDVTALLDGFGAPETLAAQYVAHIRNGAPPPSGFRVIQRVRQGVTRGLYYSFGASGFALALALLWLALAKVFDPQMVGLWASADGHSHALTWSGTPYAQGEEVLGYGLVPVALLAALWCAELTRRVLRVLRRGLS